MGYSTTKIDPADAIRIITSGNFVVTEASNVDYFKGTVGAILDVHPSWIDEVVVTDHYPPRYTVTFANGNWVTFEWS